MSSPASSNEEQEEKIAESPDAKEEEHDSEDENDKPSPKKEEKPSSVSPKKSKQPNDTAEKDEESGDDSDGGVGLLDRPVEVSGSRERKKVQRLEVSFTTSSKDKHEIPEGSGEKLGDCPRIELQIQKNPINELKNLHRILFSRPGSGNEIKKNIRKFSGFTFKKVSSEFDKKKTALEKLPLAALKHMCEVLDIERGGTKEDIISRMMDFFMEPKASGKKVPQSKRKSAGKSAKRKREKKDSKNVSTKKKTSSSDEDKDEESEADSEADQKSDDDEDSEESKKKKSKPTPKKKESQAKQKKSVKPKKTEKKSTSKPVKKKEASSDDDDDADSDDEPLAKKAKSPPTNEDIKALVKKILDSADLQEITMKKVIKQVFAEFPEFDLSDKKGFIKTTVKSISGS